MIQIGTTVYYRDEVTMGQYRRALMYAHRVEDELSTVELLYEVMRLIPRLYNGQFTSEELDKDRVYSGKYKDEQDFVTQMEQEINAIMTDVRVTQQRYKEVVDKEVLQDGGVKGEPEVITVGMQRKSLIETYQNLVYKGKVLTFNELDNMFFVDFMDLNSEVTKNNDVEVEDVGDDLLNELNNLRVITGGVN